METENKQAKILIVEDDVLILKTVEYKLKREGYRIVIARNGRDAVTMAEAGLPDLVVTDCYMPFMSGLELITYFKEKWPHIPIIMLSGAGLEDSVVEAFNLGVDDYIVKPFSPEELNARIKKLLKTK